MEKTRVDSLKNIDMIFNNRYVHDKYSALLREIAGSLAVIADAMQYNKSYEQICHEVAEKLWKENINEVYSWWF